MELPGINGTLSVNLIVNLVAVVELSPGEALAVGCTSAVCQSLWRKHQIEPVHIVYNLAQIALSIDLSYLCFTNQPGYLVHALPLRMIVTTSSLLRSQHRISSVSNRLDGAPCVSRTWSDFYSGRFPITWWAVSWLVRLPGRTDT